MKEFFRKIRITLQVILLNRKLPNIVNMNYDIYWLPLQQAGFATACPFVNILGGTYVAPSFDWPNGYFWVAQSLSTVEYDDVNINADNHVCLDIRPATTPPGSPHGR